MVYVSIETNIVVDPLFEGDFHSVSVLSHFPDTVIMYSFQEIESSFKCGHLLLISSMYKPAQLGLRFQKGHTYDAKCCALTHIGYVHV